MTPFNHHATQDLPSPPLPSPLPRHNLDIQVGPDLTFTPNTTSVSPGSALTFHFYSGRHNVPQSLFSTPCVRSPNGFYSGFIVPSSSDTVSPTTFIVTVNYTNPIWFYCSEYMHYQLGMVGLWNHRTGKQKEHEKFCGRFRGGGFIVHI
jgi:plastocyanin